MLLLVIGTSFFSCTWIGLQFAWMFLSIFLKVWKDKNSLGDVWFKEFAKNCLLKLNQRQFSWRGPSAGSRMKAQKTVFSATLENFNSNWQNLQFTMAFWKNLPFFGDFNLCSIGFQSQLHFIGSQGRVLVLLDKAVYCSPTLRTKLLQMFSQSSCISLSGERQRTASEYYLGKNQLWMVPVALSIVVSMVSSNTVLGVPSEVYRYGSTYVWYGVSGGVAFIFAGT